MRSSTIEYFTLSQYVNVKVPTKDIDNQSISNIMIDKWCKKLAEYFTNTFGGATVNNAVGYYNNAKLNQIQTESIYEVKSFAEKINEEHVASILNLAKEMCVELKQECVAVEINGQMKFIK